MSTNEEELQQFEKKLPVAPEAAPVISSPVSDEDKLAFLAHILTGAPFIRQYDVASVGFVEFATVPSRELDAIRRLAKSSEEKLTPLLAVASVNRLELDGRVYAPVVDRSWLDRGPYMDFIDSIPFGLLYVIESQYSAFSHTLSVLVEKVSDRSFWPTP